MPLTHHLKAAWPSWLLGLIFLTAGLSKLGKSELVFAGVMQYQLFEANTAFTLADVLPWVEILLGIALFVPALRKTALGVATALQLLFFAGLIQAALRQLEVTCVCFGTRAGGTALLFVQELLLLGLTAFAAWTGRKLPQK